jgi:hypothetical protein
LDNSTWPTIANYVKDVIGTFANDSRVLMWDLWNEPDGGFDSNQVQILNQIMSMVFEWARSVNPIQPLTSGIFHGLDGATPMVQINNSDVVSFHK